MVLIQKKTGEWIEADSCKGHGNADMTKNKECFVSLNDLDKVFGLQFGDAVHVKVRALNDAGWGEYGPQNNDVYSMEREPE